MKRSTERKDAPSVRSLFLEAMDKATEPERTAYLDQACGENAELRARVEALLKAHERAGGFLKPVAFDPEVDPDRSPLTEAPGTIIGRYKLLEKIGEGGMAVVYMAEQEQPVRRRVALKIIKLGMDTKNVIARFEAERQALALMDHPNMAKIFDGGTTETGRPYFVMELVRGVSITEYCDTNRLSPRERLELFVQVCQAVQHAHTKGIIHRDLKPSNVMVTLHDSRPVPKIIDFGIAKATNQRLTEKTLFTRYAQIIGTPEYMSPEQAQMSGLDVDTRTDIYSLGVLLYELLTGTTPFGEEELRRAGYLEMQRVIREQEPIKPSTKLSTLGETLTGIAKCRNSTPELLRKAIRGDLDWIVMKSLEKDRTRRYETASGLAQDLEHHLNNEPVLASPPRTLYRFQKLVRRNKGVFAAATAVAAVLVLGALVSTWQAVRATRAQRAETRLRQEAETARANEADQRQKAEALAYASDMSLAQQALSMNDLGRARRLLEAHRPASGEVDLRGWEWRYLWQQCRSDALGELHRYPPSGHSVAYSPDGKTLAVSSSRRVDVWDVSTRQPIKTLQSNTGSLVAFSPRGDLLAAGAGDQVQLWRTGTWDLIGQPLALGGHVCAIKFSPDGKRLGSVIYPDQLTVWEIDGWAKVRQIGGVRTLTYGGTLAFSPDGRALAAGDADHRLRVFDLASGNTDVNIPEAHIESITALAWSPNGSVIASGSGFTSGAIRLSEAASGRLLGYLEGHTSWISQLVFSNDGKRLYSASGDQTIRIWDMEHMDQREPLATLRGSQDEVIALALSPDGTTLASGCKDGVVSFWDARPRREEQQPRLIPLGELPGPAFGRLGGGVLGRLVWPAFAPDSRVLAAPSSGTVRLFDLAAAKEMEQIPELGTDVQMVVYAPDGTLLVSGSTLGKIRVWSCAEHHLVRELEEHTDPILGLYFRADGKRLLSVDTKGKAIWWDALTWHAGQPFVVKSAEPGNWPAVSRDGRLLAVADHAGGMRWLDGETGELLATTPWRAESSGATSVAFSNDSTRAASVSAGGTLAIWDTSSRQPLIAPFKGQTLGAHAAAFSADGRRLATGSNGREAVKLWDMSTYRELVALPGEGSMFCFVAFSPDGEWLAACNWEGLLHLWRAPSWAQIEAAEKRSKNE